MKLLTSIFLISLASTCFSHIPMISKTYTFKPNEPQNVDNPLFWDLDAKCSIESSDPENSMLGKMIRKNGKLNGTPLNEGESTTVVVTNHSQLHIEADYNARVQITNYGPSTVVAKCSI